MILSIIEGVEITIGNVRFREVESVSIDSSWRNLSDTAKITVPKAVHLKSDDTKGITDLIKKDDPVEIKLGYNGNLRTEFIGYVDKISTSIPIVIECVDEMHQLKKGNFTKTFSSVSLPELVDFIAPGYESEVVDIELGKFTINGATPAKVLKEITEKYNLSAFFKGKTLIVGFPYRFTAQDDIFIINLQNLAAQSNLQFKSSEDNNIFVTAYAHRKDGSTEKVELGEKNGDKRTLNYGDISLESLRELATAELEKFKIDGYTGSIAAFGIPAIEFSEVVSIKDDLVPEQNGQYFVDRVIKTFGPSVGYKRINELGKRSNA